MTSTRALFTKLQTLLHSLLVTELILFMLVWSLYLQRFVYILLQNYPKSTTHSSFERQVRVTSKLCHKKVNKGLSGPRSCCYAICEPITPQAQFNDTGHPDSSDFFTQLFRFTSRECGRFFLNWLMIHLYKITVKCFKQLMSYHKQSELAKNKPTHWIVSTNFRLSFSIYLISP